MGREEREAGAAFGRITEVEIALARSTARTLERRNAGRVGPGDLESLASTLLVDAALAFDARKGVSFRAYAARFIGFGLRDALRGLRRKRIASEEDAALALQSEFDRSRAVEDPTARRIAEDDLAALREAIDGLDPVDAALLRGFHLEGRPIAELALEVGLPTTTAWRRRVAAFAEVQRTIRAWPSTRRTKPIASPESTRSLRPRIDSPPATASEVTSASSDSWREAV